MKRLELLEHAEAQLVDVIGGLTDRELDAETNCPPWTVRRLASHAVKNQLFWAGCITGQPLMALEESMGAVPYDGDLAPIAVEVATQVLELWRDPEVMTRIHSTPFGDLPGSVVIDFAVIDAAAHAWDLSASLGRAVEFPPPTISSMWDVVGATCTEHTVQLGLIKPPTEPPRGASETQRMMAAAGRTIPA